jgi:hypothetical protein
VHTGRSWLTLLPGSWAQALDVYGRMRLKAMTRRGDARTKSSAEWGFGAAASLGSAELGGI